MAKSITIYGASDDLIEVEGAITEEFGAYNEEEGLYVAVSDGHLLRIKYDDDGCWRIAKIKPGSSKFEKTEGDPDGEYSDRVTLTGDALSWVVLGKSMAKADAPSEARPS